MGETARFILRFIMPTKVKSPGASAAGRVASILVAIVAITPLPIMARSVQHMYAERDGIAMGVDEQLASGSVHVARTAVKTATFAAHTLTVAVAQTASNETTTPEAMAVHMIEFVADAAARGARVVVFPEMAVSLCPLPCEASIVSRAGWSIVVVVVVVLSLSLSVSVTDSCTHSLLLSNSHTGTIHLLVSNMCKGGWVLARDNQLQQVLRTSAQSREHTC